MLRPARRGGRRARRLPRGARRDAHRRSRPDRRGARRCRWPTSSRRTGRCSSPTPTGPRRPRSRSARPRGPAPSTSSTPAAPSPAPTSASASRLRELTGVDLIAWLAGEDGSRWSRDGRGRSPTPDSSRPWSSATAASSAFGPGGQLRGRAREPLVVSGEPEALEADITRGRFECRRLSRRARSALVGAVSPHAGDILISAAERLRMRRLGRGQPRRRRQPRRARPRGLAGPAALRRLRPAAPGQAAAMGAARTSRR